MSFFRSRTESRKQPLCLLEIAANLRDSAEVLVRPRDPVRVPHLAIQLETLAVGGFGLVELVSDPVQQRERLECMRARIDAAALVGELHRTR